MKTHLHPIRRTAHLTLAALAIAVAASVSAQTVITPDLKAPPGAYNTSSTGMVLRAHQIFAARTPGDQNSIGNVLKELSGGFGPNLATNGPLTGGLWSEVYLNHTIEPLFPAEGDGDWWYFTAPALTFPGINTDTNQTGGFSTFAYEIITYLNLPAGITTLAVGSGDSFSLSIGAGDNPYSFAAATPGLFSGTRNYGVSTFDIDVQSAGVYPVRIIYGQGGGPAGLQFFSWNAGTRYLINDPFGGGSELTSYQPAVLPIPAPSQAYVSLLAPAPGEAGVSPQPTVRVELTDGTTTTVNTNTISLSFDNVPVSPTITKTGNVTYVFYTVPSTLVGLSTHTAQFVAQDSAANVMSNQWSFTASSFTVVPASWAYPAGSGDATQPGFAGRVHQTRDGGNGSPAVAYGNAQISGLLIDGATGLPSVNTVVTNGNPIIGAGWTGTQPADAGGGPGDARTFTATNVVNYSIADGGGAVLDSGNFNSVNGYPDALFPGLPGSIDDAFTSYNNSGEIAVELVAFVELPAGLQQIGVNCNDAFQLAISPNNARDIFRQELIKNDSNRDSQDSVTTVFVETNGVYSFRVIYRVYRDTVANQLEWFSADPDNPTTRVLLNATVVGAKKAYRAVTVPTREYVKSVSPAPGASGVSVVTPIQVVIVDRGATNPVLRVNGQVVTYSMVTNANEVTLTYTPATPFSGGQTVNCEVQYGGLTGQWSFVARSGRRAVLITSGTTASSGDVTVVNRLSSKYGLDVTLVAQSYVQANPTDMSIVSNTTLIAVSSLVSGGNVAAWCRNYVSSNIPVPVIFWEYAVADDFGLTEGSAGGAQGLTQVFITDAPALTAGFTNGQVVTTHTGAGGGGNCPAAPGTINAAYPASGTGNPVLVGAPVGLVVNSSLLGTVTHPSRKVFFGLLNNDSAVNLSEDGLKLFDAAIEWLVPAPPAVPPVLTATPAPGRQVTLSWTSTGTLQTHTNLTTTNWVNTPSQINPQTVPATDPQRYYRVKQ